MKTFISSTSEDLKSYRSAAAHVIQDMQSEPVGMEHFPADPRPVIELCRDEVGKCGLVILLQAFRRGWVPRVDQGGDGKTSITGLEIRAAMDLEIPVLCFLADDNWPGKHWDSDPAALEWTKTFRGELNRNAKFFKWEDDPELPMFRALLRQELANYRLRELGVPDESPPAALTVRRPAARPLPAEPYPLLGPYEHPDTFAGRDAEITKLVSLIKQPPLVLCVHATSGAGKSSLLLAGLAPRLEAEGYAVSVERAPKDGGLAQRLVRDLLEPPELIRIEDDDRELPAKFAKWISQARTLSGKPVVLVIDQIDDVLRKAGTRDEGMARLGPLIAATAERLPGAQGFACKWVLCYRHEFHGEVRAWLEDVLAQARKQRLYDLASLPHDLTDIQRSHDWALPVMGKPAPGDQALEQSTRAFLEAIERPLRLKDHDRLRYGYVIAGDGAQRLASLFAHARQDQADAPLAPELQVILNHLLELAVERGGDSERKEPIVVDVPSDESLNAEFGNALANHLQRALSAAFPQERDQMNARLQRTRALLALRQLADAKGLRGSGLPEGELVRMLDPNGREVLDRLSSPQARLVVNEGGTCALSHDRLAEVLTEVVRNEASRGNLLLDQSLIDLQWTVGQKVALYDGAGNDESALALTKQQRELIAENQNTLLFDDARRGWWQASEARERDLAKKRRNRIGAAVGALAAAIVAVLTILMPPHVGFSPESYEAEASQWVVHEGRAVFATPGKNLGFWELGKPWSSHSSYALACPKLQISASAEYLACVRDNGDLYVWQSGRNIDFNTGHVFSGPSWINSSILFGANDKYVVAANVSGDIFVSPINQLIDGQAPLGPRIHVDSSKWSPPQVALSPTGAWMTIGADDNNVYLINTAIKPGSNDSSIAQSTEPFIKSLPQFSVDERIAVWHRKESDEIVIRTLSTGKEELIQLLPNVNSRSGHNDFFLRISDDSKWLVGREVYMPFITWNIGESRSSAGIVSGGGAAKNTESDRWPSWISFAPDSAWVAGPANDGKLYLWKTSDPADRKDRPIFQDSYRNGEASLAFSSGSDQIAVLSPNGELFVWQVAGPYEQSRPLARLYTGAQFEFSKDGKFIYT